MTEEQNLLIGGIYNSQAKEIHRIYDQNISLSSKTRGLGNLDMVLENLLIINFDILIVWRLEEAS